MNNDFISIPNFYAFTYTAIEFTDILTYLVLKSFFNAETGKSNTDITDVCDKLHLRKEDLSISLSRLSRGKLISYTPQNDSLIMTFLEEHHLVMIPRELINAPLSKLGKTLLIVLKMLDDRESPLYPAISTIKQYFNVDFEKLWHTAMKLSDKEYLFLDDLEETDRCEYYFSELLNWYEGFPTPLI